MARPRETPGRQFLGDVGGAARPAEVETLRARAPERAQASGLRLRLHALGHDADAERVAQGNQHRHDRLAREPARRTGDERTVDLELVEWELVQVAQG
jgi:hypothetical protein